MRVTTILTRIKKYHPCFSEKAHKTRKRMHLAVAPRCNIVCNYCERSLANYDENRPGVCGRILTPDEAWEKASADISRQRDIAVVGIAGPGEPLANEETFETFRRIGESFPEIIKCASTNGLLLSECVERLVALNINTITITVNTLDPALGARIYSGIYYQGKRYTGEEAAGILIEKQWQGIALALSKGLMVKINTVLIPEINLAHIPRVARRAAEYGAHLMNIMPLIPLYKFKNNRAPVCRELKDVRDSCEEHIPQFRVCKQCRADAVGIPGRDQGLPSYHF